MISQWIHRDFRFDGRGFKSLEELTDFIDRNYPEGSDLIRSWIGAEGKIEVMTSGSTGAPSTVVLTREQMRQSALATANFFDLQQGANALLCLPLKYIAGKMMLVRAMTLGWRLEGIAPVIHLDLPKVRTFDFAAMIPIQVASNLEKLEKFRTLIVGGAPVHKDLEKALEGLSTRVYATYGMTETVTHIALRPLSHKAGKKDDRQVFTGLRGVAFESDSRGCLVIHCPRISTERIVTNDMVELLSESEFIWRGRFDNVVNSGGLKLIPEEIERKFSDLISKRFFVTGLPDEQLGQKLALVVEGEPDRDLLGRLKAFQSASNGRIEKHEVPKDLVFLPSFIETDSKKVDRRRTLEQI